jgi:hypothetical protein
MLLQVFLLLSALLLLASKLLSLLMLFLDPMHLLVFLLLLALLLLETLHYECCSMMSLLLLFSRPHAGKVFRTLQVSGRRPLHSQMPEKFSGPRKATFHILSCRKILVPVARPGLPPGARLLWHGGM